MTQAHGEIEVYAESGEDAMAVARVMLRDDYGIEATDMTTDGKPIKEANGRLIFEVEYWGRLAASEARYDQHPLDAPDRFEIDSYGRERPQFDPDEERAYIESVTRCDRSDHDHSSLEDARSCYQNEVSQQDEENNSND